MWANQSDKDYEEILSGIIINDVWCKRVYICVIWFR